MKESKNLTAEKKEGLLTLLKTRFEANPARHREVQWQPVLAKLEANPEKLGALSRMEETGGEPDVIGYDSAADVYLFCDCAPESPEGRRNLCFDEAALAARKKNKPQGSAMALAADMGIELLSEAEYYALQELGAFDTKTSSWVATPPEVRTLGGALFCDRRYNKVFTYHNGADSYYGVRGFRGVLRV